MERQQIIAAVNRWIQGTVLDLNLCPFAGVPLAQGRVRFALTQADSVELLLRQLDAELALLDHDTDIETTLLIHPQVLNDFLAYNQFLTLAEGLLVESNRDGVYQIASFHPDYQFAGTAPADAENYSNRSPYPMLHLLREDSVARALANFADPEAIPERNIERLNDIGAEKLQAMLTDCIET